MKGYRVVLPPKDKDGNPIMGRGISVFTPEGIELTSIMGINVRADAGDIATVTLELPVSVIEHSERNK